MSELIKKFQPPKIEKYYLEQGRRNLVLPETKDFLGQTLKAGDFVLYTTNDSIYEVGKVIGIYETIDKGKEKGTIYLSVAFERRRWWGNEPSKVKRQSGVLPVRLVKVSFEICSDKVSEQLMVA